MSVTRSLPSRKSRSLRQSPTPRTGRILGGALGLGAAALASIPADGATFNVTNLADSGDGSLRKAILDANAAAGADVITFEPGVTGTIDVAAGQMQILESLNIVGPGAANLTLDAHGASGLFFVGSEVDGAVLDVTISGLTLTNGGGEVGGAVSAQGLYFVSHYEYIRQTNDVDLVLDHVTITNSSSFVGGGVCVRDANLTLQDAVISGNESYEEGGGVYFDGEISAVTILDSQIENNTTPNSSGGGVYIGDAASVTIEDSILAGNEAGGDGAGLFIAQVGSHYYDGNGDITLLRNTISNNLAVGSGGGAYLYDMDGYGQATIADSTISGNTAGRSGGGLAFYEMDSEVTVRNTTISGNTAEIGGGVYFYDGDGATLDFATIVDNQAYSGAGVYLYSGGITISNSVIADNSGSDDVTVANHGYTYAEAGFSFIESYGGNLYDQGGNIEASDPLLGPLADNGGPTLTHLPLAGSPLIDAADPGSTIDTDQRGESRPFGAGPDMGAVEVHEAAPGTTATLNFSIYNQGRRISDPSQVKALVSDRDSLGTYPAGKDVPLELTLTSPLTCVDPGCTPMIGSGEKADYTATVNYGPGVFGRHLLADVPGNGADDNGDGTFTLAGDGSANAVSFLPGRYLWIIADSTDSAGQTLPVLKANDKAMQFLDAPSVPTFGDLSVLKVTFTESEAAGGGSANPRVNVYFVGYPNPMVVQLGDAPYTGGAASSSGTNLLTQGGARFDTSGLGGSSGQDAGTAAGVVGGYTISRVDFVTGPSAGAHASYTLQSIYLQAEAAAPAALSAHAQSTAGRNGATASKPAPHRPSVTAARGKAVATNHGKAHAASKKRTGHRVIASVTESKGTVVLKFRDGSSMKVPSDMLRIRTGPRAGKQTESTAASLVKGQRVDIETSAKGVVKVRVKGQGRENRQNRPTR